MKRAYISVIALCVVLIFAITLIPVQAFAQDPFSTIAIGGIGGASGAGLFGSMAAASGININYVSDPVNDAMWNKLNSDSVYFSGEKHEASGTGEDIYDYINVDIGDWLQAQSDFIQEFVTQNNVTDNDNGSINTPASIDGYTFDRQATYWYMGVQVGVIQSGADYTIGRARIAFSATNTVLTVSRWFDNTKYTDITVSPSAYLGKPLYIGQYGDFSQVNWLWESDPQTTRTGWATGYGRTTYTPSNTIPWSSDTVNTSIFDNYNSAKVKIPSSISQLQTGWTVPEFLEELNRMWENNLQTNIVIENTAQPAPTPTPEPLPTTPLGQMPFDEWVDTWGQSIFEKLYNIEEKQELMVINTNDLPEDLHDLNDKSQDIIDGVDDLIGLVTNIDENLEDGIVYEQGISTDVGNIDENVEDIEDEVIVIVDEMGNVIDVLEGIDAKIYAQGGTLSDVADDVGTLVQTETAIATDIAAAEETLEDIKDVVVPYIPVIPQIKTATETQTRTLTQTKDAIISEIQDQTQDMTDTMTDTKDAIIQEIQDATTTLTDDIPNITDICENIDEAPYKDIDTGIDRIPSFIAPYIVDLRGALGIWHYVTEWLAQISTTFAFISGCLVGTSIMSPIYAAIAGFMCIRVYRRMCG